jgi:hypothetical protein
VSRVELRKHFGIGIGSGKEIFLNQFIVLLDGRQVGYKGCEHGSPINLTSRLSEEHLSIVKEEIDLLLGDDPKANELMGTWKHEDDPEHQGETSDDIFD